MHHESEAMSEIVGLIQSALGEVQDPELRRSLTELDMVESIAVTDGVAAIGIRLTIAGCPMRDQLTKNVTTRLLEVPGVRDVTLSFTVMNEAQRQKVREVLRGGNAEKVIPFAQPGSLTKVIGIASGKGGVGKSSLTANLAIALAQKNLRVGILDADVYGHSIPRLMGLIDQRPTAIDQTFIPLEAYGVKVVSMEMFKPDRAEPVAYRGPLLHRVLEQLLADAYWGDLDILLLDLPPGTGDLAISLGQLIPNSEIVVVTTPQIAAAEVAERAGRIGHQLKQRISGVIENMAGFPCPHCGETVDLFGQGGGEATAKALSNLTGAPVSVIARIPFDIELRSGGDKSAPLVAAHPERPAAQAIMDAALALAGKPRGLVGMSLGISSSRN